MSIMDIFKSITGTATPQQTPPANNIDPSKNPAVPGSEVKSDGSIKAIPAAAEGDKSPLSNFADLWQTDPNAKPPTSLVPEMAADPAKIFAAAKNVDFSKAISPEALDKAAKGDATALATIINQAAQAGFGQSALATSKIVENALKAQEKVFNDRIIPDILRKNNISNELRADNSLFDNPAVAPVLSSIEAQLTAKNPTASPAQIKEKAQEFLQGFAQEIAASSGRKITDAEPAPGTKGSNKRAEQDWGKFFGETA